MQVLHRAVQRGAQLAAFALLVTPRLAWTQCEIMGPTEVCSGSPIQLCGPPGSNFQWTGPGGFTAATQCIDVSAPGDYTLVRFFDDMNGLWFGPCTQTVAPGSDCPPPDDDPPGDDPPGAQACPKPPSWWLKQCIGGRGAGFSSGGIDGVARCVDSKSEAVDGSRTANLCSVLRNRYDLRSRAKRHVAAVWANVCAGDLGVSSQRGGSVSLPRSTPVRLGRLETTVGEWLDQSERALAGLERRRMRDRSVKQAYREIVRVGWFIDHGMGIGPTCGSEPAAGLAAEDRNAASEMSDEGSSLDMSVSSSGRMTAVDFSLDAMAAEDVSVAVFDVSGRRIADIAHGSYAPGEHRVEWDGRMRDGSSARNGVYFVRAWTRDQSSDMRVTVLR
jgi:hypothetical protein